MDTKIKLLSGERKLMVTMLEALREVDYGGPLKDFMSDKEIIDSLVLLRRILREVA